MIARFDKFSTYDEPKFYLCSPGCKYVDGTLTNMSGVLSAISDEEIQFNFNAESELNFRAYRISSTDYVEEDYVNRLYRTLQNKRLIFVDDVGFFIVTNVKEGWSDGQQYKDIAAESVEYELECKLMPSLLEGTDDPDAEVTIAFYDLLSKLVGSSGVATAWTIGHIDSDIYTRYRTFSGISDDENILNFMLSDMQDAYECIFVFDIITRTVNAYDTESYLKETSIHITRDDLIESIGITEDCADLYTAIGVSGGDDLSINAINPLGTRVLYRFDYYLDWMSAELKTKVEAWQSLVDSKFNENYIHAIRYYNDMETKNTISYELQKLNICLTQYTRCRDNIIAEDGLDEVASYNSVIGDAGGTVIPEGELIPEESRKTYVLAEIDKLVNSTNAEIEEQETKYTDILVLIQEEEAELAAIHEECAMANNFTEDELKELTEYIEEGNYTDEYITVTDSMTYPERLSQMMVLYNRAKAQLKKISQPTQEYDVDVGSFVFLKEFLPFTEQIETGCLINVELEQDNVAQLFLSAMTVNYDEKSLSLTFGNRYNKYDQKSLYEDALGSIQRTANTVSYLKDVVQPIENGVLEQLSTDIASSRDLAKSSVLSSSNQDILIDDTGYTGRKVNAKTGEIEPEQIKINHQNIVFTDDAWVSSRMALGKFTAKDGTERYGLNAEILSGDIILGNELYISNGDDAEKTGFVIDADGIHVYYNSAETIALDAKTGKLTASDADLSGSIHAYSGIIGSDKNYLTIGGNSARAYIYSGTKSSFSTKGSGIYIGTDGINFYDVFAVDTDGNAAFTGTIEAKNIVVGKTEGYITNDQIGTNTINAATKIIAGSVSTNSGGCLDSDGVLGVATGVKCSNVAEGKDTFAKWGCTALTCSSSSLGTASCTSISSTSSDLGVATCTSIESQTSTLGTASSTSLTTTSLTSSSSSLGTAGCTSITSNSSSIGTATCDSLTTTSLTSSSSSLGTASCTSITSNSSSLGTADCASIKVNGTTYNSYVDITIDGTSYRLLGYTI